MSEQMPLMPEQPHPTERPAPKTIDEALKLLRDGTAHEVARLMGRERKNVERSMSRLARKGDVVRTGLFRKNPDTGRPATVWARPGWTPKVRPTEKPRARVLHPSIQGRLVTDAEGFEVNPQIDREKWKKIRGPLIGSSDLAALLGVDEYTGPWEVWDRIVLGKWEDKDSGDIRRGNRQEKNAITCFREEYGLETDPCGMIVHPKSDIIVSDLDAIVLRPDEWPEIIRDNPLWDYVREHCKGPGALETKVPRTARFFEYRDEGMLKGHAIQMQHHLEVSGLEWGVLVFYNPEYDIVLAFPVVAEERIGTWIREQIPRWYKKFIDGRERPMKPMPGPAVWPHRVKGAAKVREDAEWRDQAELVSLRYYELREATEAYEQTEAKLLELLSDDPEDNHVCGGGVVVQRTQSVSQRRFNAKAFLAAFQLAQQEEDTDTLLELDPSEDRFYFQTDPKKKSEVRVVGGNPAEQGP